MPAALKFSREELIDVGIQLVMKDGYESLSARNIAKATSSSSKPIFTLFKDMAELKCAVTRRGFELFDECINKVISSNVYPPYKATGMGYILFAKEDPNLFKMLFMRKLTASEAMPSDTPDQCINGLMKQLGIDKDTALKMHLEMWMLIHGIATTIITSYVEWDKKYIEEMLTDQFVALKQRFMEGHNGCNSNKKSD